MEEFSEFEALVKQTTANLRRLQEMQNNMHWQFGEPEWFTQFTNELSNTQLGWISSNC